MNNIRETLENVISTKLPHGGYSGTGKALFDLIKSNLSKLENLNEKVSENFGAGDDPSGIFTIQQTGAKIAGYRYFDTANKVALECIKNNSLTYADAECYVAVDNVSLNNKLQNLLKVSTFTSKFGTNPSTFTIYLDRIGDICFYNIIGTIGIEGYFGETYNKVIPEKFIPAKTLYISMVDDGGGVFELYIYSNGDVKIARSSYSHGTVYQHIGSGSTLAKF